MFVYTYIQFVCVYKDILNQRHSMYPLNGHRCYYYCDDDHPLKQQLELAILFEVAKPLDPNQIL